MAYTFLPHDSLNDTRNVAVSFSGQPILEDAASAIWLPSLYDQSGDSKRLKRTASFGEFSISIPGFISTGGSSYGSIPRNCSTSSLSTMTKLQIRDQILKYNQLYLAAEAVEEAATSVIGAENGGKAAQDEANVVGMALVQQLIFCGEAVAWRDKSHASLLLSELRANALVFGTPFQRVASCFVQGLADRLALVQPLGTVGYGVPKMNIMDVAPEKKEAALRLVYEICPHIQFGHFVANSSILEAFEGGSLVHVVDLGMTLGLPHGHQWHSLIQSLAGRPGSPPRLRITAIGLRIDKFSAIGEELETYATGLGLSLEFTVVESNLENLKPEDIKVVPGEVLVVNSILQLHCAVKESRGALKSILQVIHELSPKVLVLVEQDSSRNGPFFLGRFMEALRYYSAIFDSLDAVLPKCDTKRAKMEQFYFAEEIKNIVSCEGPARVERHERLDQWRRRMSRAGFQPIPLKLFAQAKKWLSSISACDGYTIVEERGCLVLGWKSNPVGAASCWKC